MADNWNGYPVPPPSGWRPPGWERQLGWIAIAIVATALITDLLIAVQVLWRPWEGETVGWIRQMLLCTATPLNLVGLGIAIWWAIRWMRSRGPGGSG